jgi:transposase
MRQIEGSSISDIAKRTKVNWRTAKKYADKEDWNQPGANKKRRSPIMDPYQEIIDTWLIEDEQMPRKQRHSAYKIYKRLVAEYGFTGSDRTARGYVSKRKLALELERAKTYERLEHPGGEAQVDFCTIQVSNKGQLMEYKLLIASLPYSNAAFLYPVPRENQECFLEGLKQIFYQMGGVPRRIWFDNLSAAVVSISENDNRKCTEGFLRFSAHYRFDPVFCNPNSGHEKGNVENKCGYSRRNWCVPVPIFTDQASLAKELADLAMVDRQRTHYAKENTIEDLWQQERDKLLVLPDIPYEVFRIETAVVNKYGEIRIESQSFPLTGCTPKQEVVVKMYWEHLEVLDLNYCLLAKFPRQYLQKTTEIAWKEVIKNLKRRPRAVMHSRFVAMMPEPIQVFLRQNEQELRKQNLQALAGWLDTYTLEEIASALKEAPTNQGTICDWVTHHLYRMHHSIKAPATNIPENVTPAEVKSYSPNLAAYDKLVGGKSA